MNSERMAFISCIFASQAQNEEGRLRPERGRMLAPAHWTCCRTDSFPSSAIAEAAWLVAEVLALGLDDGEVDGDFRFERQKTGTKRLVKRLVAQELTLSFVPDAEQRLWRTVMRRKDQVTCKRSPTANQSGRPRNARRPALARHVRATVRCLAGIRDAASGLPAIAHAHAGRTAHH